MTLIIADIARVMAANMAATLMMRGSFFASGMLNIMKPQVVFQRILQPMVLFLVNHIRRVVAVSLQRLVVRSLVPGLDVSE